MCGIVGYIGKRRATDVLIPGLRALEERGYDSAGIVTLEGQTARVTKLVPHGTSPSDELGAHEAITEMANATVGMAHTRWATHGVVTERNAHPHACCQGRIWIVHNGILENFDELRTMLSRTHVLRSETDSELIAHLIEEELDRATSLADAVRQATRRMRGTWGLLVLDRTSPDSFVAARLGSPLLLGVGEEEMFIASLEDAFVPYTRRMIALEDGDVVTVRADGHIGCTSQEIVIEYVTPAGEGTGSDVMRREIVEQPQTIRYALNNGGRVDLTRGTAILGGLSAHADALLGLKHLRLVGCGTAKNACEYATSLLEQVGGFDSVKTIASSEAQPEHFPSGSGVLAVSQSGETLDTLDVIRRAKGAGHRVFSIINRVGKAIARETNLGIYTNSGPEKAVASTKVFTAQTVVLNLLALWYGRQRGTLSEAMGQVLARELMNLPRKAEVALHCESQARRWAQYINERERVYLVGRGPSHAIACEGALKITEVAYLPAIGLAAGELKHGPIAILEQGFPVIAIVPSDETFDHMISCLKEVKARGAHTLVIADENGHIPADAADEIIRVPASHAWLTPILCNIPLQFVAYYAAKERGLNPDRPRNLAKSVTVK